MTPLRIDDFGASSKRYARHRGKLLPYSEAHEDDLIRLFTWLQRIDCRATLAITAAWVERDGSLTPYPKKFPRQTSIIQQAVLAGRVEIACHGLTHCIPGQHTSWPWQGNRRWHREFIDALPYGQQRAHLVRGRRILEDAFGLGVTTLVPPGNAISDQLAEAALAMGYEVVTCRLDAVAAFPSVVDDRGQCVLHDRDVIGVGRFERTVERLAVSSISGGFTTVRAWARQHGLARRTVVPA